MSRKQIRFMKQMGLDKKVNSLFDFTIKSIVDSIEEFENYRFEYNGVEYDLESIMILLPPLLGSMKDGDNLLKRTLYTEYINSSKDNNEIYKSSPISAMGALINDIFERYSKCGLDANLIRAIAIAKKANLYNGDLGGYNFDILEKTLDDNYFDGENENGELTLSQLFNSAVNNFSYRLLFNNDMVVEDFVSLYLIICAKEFDPELDDIFRFIKVLMDYFISTKQKKKLIIPIEISGDLEKDICDINADYLDILHYLDNENLLLLSLLDIIDFTDEERDTLALYQMVYKFILMDFCYKSLSVNRLNSLDQLKALHSKEISSIKKEQKKMLRQLKDSNKKISDKDL